MSQRRFLAAIVGLDLIFLAPPTLLVLIASPDLAAVSLVYIAIALAAIWLLDRLVGLAIFLRSR